jgi:LuxR family maltose regulon positive regulatory protein
MFMSRLKLARGDSVGAALFLSQAEQNARQTDFAVRLPDIAVAQVLIHLFNGDINAAVQMAQKSDCPLTQALTLILRGDPSAALALLVPHRQQLEEKGWVDRLLDTMVLQALALHALGEKDPARQVLVEALTLAEPSGFIRLFVDMGEPMRLLILDFRSWIENQPGDRTHSLMEYADKLLAAFAPSEEMPESKTNIQNSQIIEPLSQRELEVLQLICQGLSNQEICQRLFLALDTVKGHNRRIFEKLQVHSRTEAIARARELNLF